MCLNPEEILHNIMDEKLMTFTIGQAFAQVVFAIR